MIGCVVPHAAVEVIRQSILCSCFMWFGGAVGQIAGLLSWELLHVFWQGSVKCPERHWGYAGGSSD